MQRLRAIRPAETAGMFPGFLDHGDGSFEGLPQSDRASVGIVDFEGGCSRSRDLGQRSRIGDCQGQACALSLEGRDAKALDT